MAILYRIIIGLYGFLIRLSSMFNPKAAKWIIGRKNIFATLTQIGKPPGQKTVWFHCASLGEFEQGRPVIEKIREKMPEIKILLTFFSPSGYEIRKNYPGADWVTYLPLDSPSNARRFLDMVKPDMAVFVKYEYWYFFLKELRNRNIPVLLISAIFRPEQLFFKWYGHFYLRMLQFFTTIFVQDNDSLTLLVQKGIQKGVLSGDTRFDRVVDLASHPIHIPVAENFAKGYPVVVAGSTWPGDEALLIRYIKKHGRNFRWIIAPHEIHANHLTSLKSELGNTAVLFSSVKEAVNPDKQVLIIDNVGMLSSLYALADIAYIGGGFGKGIHNILEAAVFGVPVVFGPMYEKFREAREMVALKTAFPVSDYNTFEQQMNLFFDQPETRKNLGEKNMLYVTEKTGATVQIVNNMLMFL